MDWHRAFCQTSRQSLSLRKDGNRHQGLERERKHYHFPFRWWRGRKTTNRGALRQIPECASRQMPAWFSGRTRPDGPVGCDALYGLRQHAFGVLGRDEGGYHLGWYPSLRWILGLEPKAKRLRSIGFALPTLLRLWQQALFQRRLCLLERHHTKPNHRKIGRP